MKEKALAVGAERMIVRNCQKEFVEEIVWRAVQCNAIYVRDPGFQGLLPQFQLAEYWGFIFLLANDFNRRTDTFLERVWLALYWHAST